MTKKVLNRLLCLFLAASIVIAAVALVRRVREVSEYVAGVSRAEVPDYAESLTYSDYVHVMRNYYWNYRNLPVDEEKLDGDFLAAWMEDVFFYRVYSENGMEEKAKERKEAMEYHLSMAGECASHAEKILERMEHR